MKNDPFESPKERALVFLLFFLGSGLSKSQCDSITRRYRRFVADEGPRPCFVVVVERELEIHHLKAKPFIFKCSASSKKCYREGRRHDLQ